MQASIIMLSAEILTEIKRGNISFDIELMTDLHITKLKALGITSVIDDITGKWEPLPGCNPPPKVVINLGSRSLNSAISFKGNKA